MMTPDSSNWRSKLWHYFYDRNWWHWGYFWIVIYSFIVLAIWLTVITIVNYNHKKFYSTGHWWKWQVITQRVPNRSRTVGRNFNYYFLVWGFISSFAFCPMKLAIASRFHLVQGGAGFEPLNLETFVDCSTIHETTNYNSKVPSA